MLLSQFVEVKTTGSIISYYKNLGYDAKHGKIIVVDVNDLTNSSEVIVEVCCEICKKINNISYSRYFKSKSNLGIYTCFKCKGLKIKNTCLHKYGVENISQVQEFKEKKELTCMMNYGVYNPSHSPEIIEKIKNTLIKNYGVEYALQSEEIQKKFEDTMLIKYGVKHALLNKDLKEKSKKTLFKNYGVDHVSKSEEIQERSKLTRIKNFNQLPDELFTDWEIYKKKVNNITRINKKELLEKWNGYDFYDGEYIKDNYFKYNPRNKKYPSIDHKISVFYGFINNIPYNIIGSIENICITKTEINCSKKEKNYFEFLK